jgi:hypothetical protein
MIRKSKAITIVAALAVLVGTTPTPAAAQKGSCGWIPQGWDDEEGAMHGGDGLSISNLGTPAQNYDNLHQLDVPGYIHDHDHFWDCGAER